MANLEQILALLIQERDRLNRAIEALQGPVKRRGRPPKNPLASILGATTAPAQETDPLKKRGRTFSEAQRQAAAERMRKMWAAKRKAAKAK